MTNEDTETTTTAASSPSLLSGMQQKAVDEAFVKLFGYSWGTTFSLPHPHEQSPTEQLLCQAVGPRMAACILQLNPGTNNNNNNKPTVVKKPQRSVKHRIDTSSLATTKRGSSANASNSTTTNDNAKERKLSATKSAKPKAAGVNNLLNELAGSKPTSTVAKTSADWDQFKEETGLGDKLEEQAESKTAYLKRQDFLTRVDNRKFEREKTDRERKRMQRK